MKITVKNIGKYEFAIKEVLTETVAEWGDGGISVELAEQKEGLKVVSDSKNVKLYFSDVTSLLRGIGIIVSRGEDEYSVEEKCRYKNFGCMVDCSRNAVMNIDSVKRFIKISALLGMNTIQLYTEDTYEIEDEPYFGHLRGRYTLAELREIDEYASKLGVEAVPCIQTLAHLNGIFEWRRFDKIRDTADILNVALEETYEFIEKMLKTSKKAFKSNKINIGMDEAHNLGRGAYLDKCGYRERSDIMKDHLARVIELCRKYGYEPMMWSDMFFRDCSETNDYYDKNLVLTEKVLSSVPEEVNLVFWNYHFRDVKDYKYMLDNHMKFNRKVSFAGGVWTWLGFAPAQKFSIDVSKCATEALRKYDMDTVLVTIWGDNGAEASVFSCLPSLVSYAEGAWSGDTSDEAIERAMITFGASYKDFLEMDVLLYNQLWAIVHKYMLYGDVLLGTWDYHIPDDADEYFANGTRTLEECSKNNPRWSYIFDALAALTKVLSTKARLGIKLKDAYDNGDKSTLEKLANETIPSLIIDVKNFISIHRKRWLKDSKSFGFDVQDVRLGGVVARLEAAREMVNYYLSGEIDKIEELEAPRLADEGGAELNLINSEIKGKIERGSLANAYIWGQIYSKSIK